MNWRPTSCILALVVCAGSSHGLVQDTDESVQVQNEFRQALNSEDWAGAIAAGRKLAQLRPADPVPAYNLACVHARSGEKDQAVAWLRIAADRGFYFTATLLRDEDLDPIHDHPGFYEALALIEKNNAAELEKFKRRHPNPTVITVLPSGLDTARPTPLIVALHGRGATAANMVAAWRKVADEARAILIAPQAVKDMGGGFDWGVVEQGEWLVLDAIAKAKARHRIDDKKIVLTGFSQGGAMTYLIGLRHPELFAGLIPMAGYYEHRIAPIPVKSIAAGDANEANSARRLPRFYIMYGELDDDVENNREAARRLEAIGTPHVLKIYPGVGHTFPPNSQKELTAAVRFALEN